MEPINTNYDEDDVKAAIANALENFYGSLIAKISKKKLQNETSLGATAVKRAIEYLTNLGIISKGYNGNKNGWTVNTPFTVDENYFD